ncbi:MAG TPA: hypothetical protein DGH68_09565 [Bacteroidetes bacterium]|nr:hypothetical protein [Bacteroidota bacterium]
MRQIVKALVLAGIVLCTIIPAQSQIRVYAGKYNDPDKWFAGAGYRIGIIPLIDIIPNYEYLFVESGHFSTLSVDGTIGFLVVGYAGAGIGTNFAKGSGTDTKTNAVFNLLGGVELKAVPLSPFLQLKYVMLSGGGNTLMAGAGIHL